MIDAALRAALVTVLRRSFPALHDDAREIELGEVAETVVGIVRAHDGTKVVGIRHDVTALGNASTPGWDDPRKAARHDPVER